MTTKHVAVIGATGQAGTPLTKNLLAGGHRARSYVSELVPWRQYNLCQRL
jgi:nucleoside-diphosphate-sugar epimerase